MTPTPAMIRQVRDTLLGLQAKADAAAAQGRLVVDVHVYVGSRRAVLAWPAERIVVWADTRTPLSHP